MAEGKGGGSSGGIGFFEVLTIVFITLKLTGTIQWSWWLVLLPLYGPLVFLIGLLVIGLAIVFLISGGAAVEKILRDSLR